MPLTRRQLVSPTIQKARVLDVDTVNYKLVVATEFTKKPLSSVSFMTPYQHFANGEGIYFMPEVGSVCWLVEPSDGGIPFVIGWTCIEDEDSSMRGRKMGLNPGDIYLGTRDENHILLRRGGVVEIGATPLAQRLYIPIDNVIRDLCAQYSLQTLGGNLEWTFKNPQHTKDGRRQTVLTLEAREYANDQAPITTVRIGSHGEGDATILSLVLRDSGSKNAQAMIELSLKKSGDIDLTSEGTVTWEITGDVKVHAQNIDLHADQKATLQGDVEADVIGGLVNIEAQSGAVSVKAAGGTAITTTGAGPALSVGAASLPPVLATPALLTWLTTHTHICAPSGSPSGPPSTLDTDALQAKDIASS